ncbi:MAG: uracil-DNA glycosylase family protein [Pyrinomonadaceae bacterium]
MQNPQVSEEFVLLTRDVRENLSYLHELGIESADSPNAAQQESQSLRSYPADDIQESLPRRASVSQPLTKQNVSASRGSVLPPGVPPVKPPATPTETLFGDLTPAASKLEPTTETFEDIWADIGNCIRCPLHQGRTNIVHTEGNRRARLMFVGEAPGADEDAQARPFVGRAGQLLTKIIEAIGFKREEVLIGNVNRCRPPGNRPPTEDEATMCKPFLLREIAAVQPEVIVVMGNTAMRNLLNTKQGITRLRGEFQDYRGVKVMPTFHPAYLLRDPSKKQETWQDLKKVRDYLEATAKRNS